MLTPFLTKYCLLMNERRLRKAISDVSFEIERYEAAESISRINGEEVKQVECECCGLKEECTHDYISKVEVSHSGYWVCGLCSEAVKGKLEKAPNMAIPEALTSHKHFCQQFNSTIRLNPKLSLTGAMRDIARKSSQKRNSNNLSLSKLARTTSCIPRIGLNQ